MSNPIIHLVDTKPYTLRIKSLDMENRIREIREMRGWTQTQLGERIGTNADRISKLERGERPLVTIWLEKVAKGLEVAPAELLPGGSAIPQNYSLLNERIMLGVLERTFEIFATSPGALKAAVSEYGLDGLSKLLLGIYYAVIEEENELREESKISKALIKSHLRVVK